MAGQPCPACPPGGGWERGREAERRGVAEEAQRLAEEESARNRGEAKGEEEDTPADTMIKEALMVGQFETAVDLCLKNDRTTDALLLAM